MAHTKPYPLTVDTRFESPTHEMVQDIVDGTIDVGFLWGPIAGYYRKRDDLPITLVPLPSEPGAARMEYHIAMGVRANEPEWRRRASMPRSSSAKARSRRSCATTASRCLNEQGELISP